MKLKTLENLVKRSLAGAECFVGWLFRLSRGWRLNSRAKLRSMQQQLRPSNGSLQSSGTSCRSRRRFRLQLRLRSRAGRVRAASKSRNLPTKRPCSRFLLFCTSPQTSLYMLLLDSAERGSARNGCYLLVATVFWQCMTKMGDLAALKSSCRLLSVAQRPLWQSHHIQDPKDKEEIKKRILCKAEVHPPAYLGYSNLQCQLDLIAGSGRHP